MGQDKIENAIDLASFNHKAPRQELMLAFPAVASIERRLVRKVIASLQGEDMHGLRPEIMILRGCSSKIWGCERLLRPMFKLQHEQ
jgi:hypothetical protein